MSRYWSMSTKFICKCLAYPADNRCFIVSSGAVWSLLVSFSLHVENRWSVYLWRWLNSLLKSSVLFLLFKLFIEQDVWIEANITCGPWSSQFKSTRFRSILWLKVFLRSFFYLTQFISCILLLYFHFFILDQFLWRFLNFLFIYAVWARSLFWWSFSLYLLV